MSGRHQETSLIATWADAQQKVLEGWFYLAQQFGPTPEADPIVLTPSTRRKQL